MAEKASRRSILKNAAAAAGALGGSALLAGTAEARTPSPEKKAWGPPPKNGEAPLFSSAWLLDVLRRALDRTPPQVFNSDGDEVVFHTVRFPFAAKVTVRSVEARLGQLGDLRRETATFWNWLGPTTAKRPAVKGEKAIVWNVTLDDGGVVLGNIELTDGAVVLSVSSAARR